MDTIELFPREQREMLALHLPVLLAAAETICANTEMSEAPLPPIFAHMYGGVPQVRLGDLLRCWLAAEESPWRFTNEQGHACYCVFRLFGLSGCRAAEAYDSVTRKQVTPSYNIGSFDAWGALKKHCRKPVCPAPLRLEQVIARFVPQPRPIVFVPHASDKLIKHCGLSIMPEEQERLARHCAALYTDEMVPSDALAVIAPLSRLVVDAAREEQDAVPTRLHDGRLIREHAGERRVRRLLNVHHRPLRDVLRRYLRESLAIHGTARLLDIRSYPASFSQPEAVGGAQPDVCIGCDAAQFPAALAQAVADCARRHGLTSAYNNPSAGAFLPADFQGNPRVLALSLHLKRRCYMDELTLQPHAGLPRLRSFVSAVADLIRAFPLGH